MRIWQQRRLCRYEYPDLRVPSDCSPPADAPSDSIGSKLANLIEAQTGYETRVTVLGHIQRGGRPPRSIGSSRPRFGVQLPTWQIAGEFREMAALRQNHIVAVPLTEATANLKMVDPALYSVAEVFFG